MTRYASFTELRKAIANSDVRLPDASITQKALQGACFTQGDVSYLEALFLQLWGVLCGEELVKEYAFDSTRRWRFDFALPAKRIAFEVEGGLHSGRHTRPTGYTADCEKYNAATMAGWRVIRLTPAQLSIPYLIPIVDWASHE